jgi:DNA topoisomerase-1
MAKNLVIVESPTKAKTIARYLGSKYTVKASVGHVRDLPKSQLGVDVEHGFKPKYVVPKDKKTVVKELKEAAKNASSVYLATDPDREGEAISWHVVEAIGINGDLPVHRVVFHEITKEAIKEAFDRPRGIDLQLVDAQQARRILDRLVGYKLSPILWKKVKRGLSAGRVQSVAVRLIVDREREIRAFVPVEYWSIEAELLKKPQPGKRAKPQSFRAALVSRFGKREKLALRNEGEVKAIVEALGGAAYRVADVREKEVQRQPSPPFTTSTLQQEASRKLRFTAKRTMVVAQQLYEGVTLGPEGNVGLITYMRTDSTNVSASAIAETRALIKERYGPDFVPPGPRVFSKKAKGAQEAHEAIRPTSVRREPEALKGYLTSEQYRLYELIWKRMVASQMAAAIFDTTTVDIRASVDESTAYLFRASGSVMRFAGFISVYSEGKDDETDDGTKKPLPPLIIGEDLDLTKLLPQQHFTQPPPRYTEATLIKALEEQGIGRPSTYAPILSTIQERNYVVKVERRFQPTELGEIVNDLLVEHFPDIVDVGFTAQMEEELDDIAAGEKKIEPVLSRFYGPFEKTLDAASATIEKVKIADEPAGEDCDKCGRPMVIKLGRYGKFIACSGFPECRNAKPLLIKTGAACPSCGGDLVQKKTKGRRTFYGCSRYPECTFTTWNRPIAQPCPTCGGLMIQDSNRRIKCTKCGYASATEEKEADVGA